MAGMTGFRVLLCAAIAVVWALGAQALRAEPLRFITNVNSHPHNDKAPGFSIEVVRDVFAAMGRDVSFEFIPPSRAWVMIVRGERDGISDALRTGARERICLFPDEPQTRDRSVFFVRTADIRKLKFSSFDDLVGHDVATNKSFLPDWPNIQACRPNCPNSFASITTLLKPTATPKVSACWQPAVSIMQP